jgi:hypothetical protein
VRDVEMNITTGAKRLPGLLWCTARYAQAPTPDAGPGNALFDAEDGLTVLDWEFAHVGDAAEDWAMLF